MSASVPHEGHPNLTNYSMTSSDSLTFNIAAHLQQKVGEPDMEVADLYSVLLGEIVD